MMRARITIAAIWLLLIPNVLAAAKPAPSPAPNAQKNGIRLVGGSGPIGRVEVSSKDSWVTGGLPGVAWRPICDDSSFDDELAQELCELLGFKYGRKHYSPKANFQNPNSTTLSAPLSNLRCTPTSTRGRRHLASTEGAALGDTSDGAKGRALLALAAGTVNIPRKAPYTCSFTSSMCIATDKLAAVECSRKPLPPAPSPPPRPPSPPPAPPPISTYIRVVGGAPNSEIRIESNLCIGNNDPRCTGAYKYGRVEVQVKAPNSNSMVWAPLCAASEANQDNLGSLVCRQMADWDGASRGPLVSVNARLPDTPFAIPQGAVTAAGAFDPSKYNAWVTVGGGDFNTAKLVQDLKLQVTSSRCLDKKMFTVSCDIVMI